VASVAVSTPSSALLIGVSDSTLGSTTATATEKDASGNALSDRTVSWSSSATTVATVDASGVIRAVGEGTATITATSEEKSGQISVTVTRPPVLQVNVVPLTSSIKVGAAETLAVTLLDAAGHSLTGRLIATVNNSPTLITVSGGQVTGVAAGTATVNFSSEGITTVATISVTP
jgi:uncharacterized protein YjdB